MKLLDWLKSLALLSVVLFFGYGSYLLYVTAQSEKQIVARVSQTFTAADAAIVNVNTATSKIGAAFTNAATSVSQAETDVRGVSTQLSGVASGLQYTVTLVNAPCAPGPCGTVADVNKTLATFRGTAGQIEIAANTFDKNESHFYSQEDQLYNDSDAAVNHLNSLLTSPDLSATIRNTSTITYNLGETTGDFQTKFHSFLYPPACKGFKCWIKNGYETIRVGSELVEPAYFGWALVNQIKP